MSSDSLAVLLSAEPKRAAEGGRVVRTIAAFLPPAIVVVSIGSMVATLGLVSGLSYASRLLLGTRRSVKSGGPLTELSVNVRRR